MLFEYDVNYASKMFSYNLPELVVPSGESAKDKYNEFMNKISSSNSFKKVKGITEKGTKVVMAILTKIKEIVLKIWGKLFPDMRSNLEKLRDIIIKIVKKIDKYIENPTNAPKKIKVPRFLFHPQFNKLVNLKLVGNLSDDLEEIIDLDSEFFNKGVDSKKVSVKFNDVKKYLKDLTNEDDYNGEYTTTDKSPSEISYVLHFFIETLGDIESILWKINRHAPIVAKIVEKYKEKYVKIEQERQDYMKANPDAADNKTSEMRNIERNMRNSFREWHDVKATYEGIANITKSVEELCGEFIKLAKKVVLTYTKDKDSEEVKYTLKTKKKAAKESFSYYESNTSYYIQEYYNLDNFNPIEGYAEALLPGNIDEFLEKTLTFIFGKPEVWKKKIKGIEETEKDKKMKKMLKKELVTKETKLRKIWDALFTWLGMRMISKPIKKVLNKSLKAPELAAKAKGLGGHVGLFLTIFSLALFILKRVISYLMPEGKVDIERLKELKSFYVDKLEKFQELATKGVDPKKQQVLNKSIETLSTIVEEIEDKIDSVNGLREYLGPRYRTGNFKKTKLKTHK